MRKAMRDQFPGVGQVRAKSSLGCRSGLPVRILPPLILPCLFAIGLSGALLAADEIVVWAVPGIEKVRPEQRIQSQNLVWSRDSKTVRVAGAANEHVPFQVVITTEPPPNRYVQAESGFWVEVTDLASKEGNRIPKESVHLYFEHAILVYAKSSPVGETGFWPDALAPLTHPFSMAAAFRESVRNRPIWIDIVVPKEAAAGDYSGKVRVSHKGSLVDELQLNLKVYGFALPDETHLLTYMGVSSNSMRGIHEIGSSPDEMNDLIQKYHRFLYERRMEPWFNRMLQPEINVSGDEVSLTFDHDLYRTYMTELGTKRVVLEAVPRELWSDEEEEAPTEVVSRVESYVRQIVDFYESNGWKDRLVFNSPIDEPNTARHYELTRFWADVVHRVDSKIPFLVTESPIPDRPEWGKLTGYASNFSVHGNKLNDLELKQMIPQLIHEGAEISWYISCDQVYPQPNYFIDAPAMDPVMIPWITYRYGMKGILYWAVNFWPQTPDPWVDSVTYISGFLCSEGGVLSGEGSLLYPGNRVQRNTGQSNVDGPVSSIRLELLREGIEDYEYLWMLRSLGEGEFADKLAAEMVIDVSAFSRNVEQLYDVRERMAQRIEERIGRK